MNKIGLYIHVPFCEKKCPYCDFYSVRGTEELLDDYTDCLIERIKYEIERIGRPADTLYFGGGTPGLLGGKRIARLVGQAKACFGLENAEITAEVNPGDHLEDFLQGFASAGGNRLSIGLQSANDEELRLLGRRHTAAQAAETVHAARRAGMQNISLDLMLGIQGQDRESLRRSIAFCAEQDVEHVSAYLLKIEPRTVYDKRRDSLKLPDEDETCALYLLACEELEKAGLKQYEISNFAKPGCESRHNLKYWLCEEYLGLGPAAHSFLNGERFYYERDLRAFLAGAAPVIDNDPEMPAGCPEEFAMLALRLTEGLQDGDYTARFGTPVPDGWKRAAKRYEQAGLTECKADGFRFTRRGFLVSNALLSEILYNS